MPKPIENYLPADVEARPVQGNIPVPLLSAVDEYRRTTRKNLTWSELITALFQRLADEKKLKIKR